MLTEQTTEFGIRSKTRVPKTFSLLLYYIVSIISVQCVVENFILVKIPDGSLYVFFRFSSAFIEKAPVVLSA